MKREQLEHILRAASAITKQGTFLIVGSQAIIGVIPEPPGILGYSMEADIVPIDAPELADLIDGSLGELSPFHDTFGYYAQGVGLDTAILPEGWDRRLIRIEEPTSRAIGFCLDPADLAASKLAAGREKDMPFVASMLSHGIIRRDEVHERIGAIPEARMSQYGLSVAILENRLEQSIRLAQKNAQAEEPKPTGSGASQAEWEAKHGKGSDIER